MDLNAPFLHDFYYQAMANDLLDIEDGRRYRCASRFVASEISEYEHLRS